jgi:putative zinc finger protein
MSSCSSPLAEDLVLDWWTGELAAAEARRVERHLLSCGSCAARAELLPAVAGGIQALVASGRLPGVLAPLVLERLRRDGRRIREYRVPAGGGVRCTVGPDDDVLIARLGVDLAGVTRVDLVTRVDDGPEQRYADLPFEPAARELIVAPPTDGVRARPAHVERMRLIAVEPEGERLLGEYTFDHTPWPGRG